MGSYRYVERVGQPFLVRARHRAKALDEAKPWVFDSILASFFVVLGLAGHWSAPNETSELHDANAWSTVLTLWAAVPFYWRRRAPLAVYSIAVMPVVILTLGNYQAGATSFFLLVGLYTVAAQCGHRARLAALLVTAVGLALIAVVGSETLTRVGVVLNVVLFGGAFVIGIAVRNHRLLAAELEQRAVSAEREREQRARRAVADERLRIAQELHDVVAHSLGVIAVQAGVGAHVIDDDPSEAKKSLESIARTSRSTLGEMRQMLGVLREDESARYQPAPGLGDLARLVRDVEEAGIPVDVEYDGTRTELPPGVEFTAYRIVQEALTNVLKHAGKTSAHVRITYEAAALAVEVTDDGRGVNGRSSGGGHGMIGMRERAGVFGGTFEAGPRREGGGFRVAVRLPYGEPR